MPTEVSRCSCGHPLHEGYTCIFRVGVGDGIFVCGCSGTPVWHWAVWFTGSSAPACGASVPEGRPAGTMDPDEVDCPACVDEILLREWKGAGS